MFLFRLSAALLLFSVLSHAQMSDDARRQQIAATLRHANANNTAETVDTLLDLGVSYRSILDEELIAAWKGDNRSSLAAVVDRTADTRVAAAVIEYSWTQRREQVFTPEFKPLLEHLMLRYPESAQPVIDDLLKPSAAGTLIPNKTQRETVCGILLDMPDSAPWRQNGLRILPRYPDQTAALLKEHLHRVDALAKVRALQWAANLRLTSLAPEAKLLMDDPDDRVRRAAAITNVQLGGYRPGGGTTAPSVLNKFDPPYTDVARRLRASGTVLLSVVVQPDGKAHDIQVIRSMGYGLDETAVETVSEWQFRPGMKDGKSLDVRANIEVNFRLLPSPRSWGTGALTFPASSGVTAPEVQSGTLPADAAEGNEAVTLEFTVDATGSVSNVRPAPGQESSSMQNLMDSLATWKFRPATRGSEPVEATGRMRFVKGSEALQPAR